MPNLSPKLSILEKIWNNSPSSSPTSNNPSTPRKTNNSTPTRSKTSRQTKQSKPRSKKSVQEPNTKTSKQKRGLGKNRSPRSFKNTPKPNPAQNISKFGGGTKGRFSPAINALKTVTARQGVKAATLRGTLANSKFLAGANSAPGLALIVGNYYVWKKNIQTLKSIYGAKPGTAIWYPKRQQQILLEKSKPPKNWYGGQNSNVSYRYKYGKATILNGAFQGWGIYYSDSPSGITLPILSVRMNINDIDYGTFEHWGFKYSASGDPQPNGSSSRTYSIDVKDATGQWKRWLTTNTQGHKVYGFEPTDGSTETNPGGGTKPAREPQYSFGGVSQKNLIPALPTQLSTNSPTLVKPPTQPSVTLKKEESNLPVVAPIPVIIPPQPTESNSDVVKLPSYIRGGLPIVTNNPTPNDTAKKPSNSVKTTYYPEVGESPEAVRARAAKLRGRVDKLKEEDGSVEKVSVVPTLPLFPIPGRVETPGTTTKFKRKPEPKPKPTKTNPCKKGCGGSSGGGGISSGANTGTLEALNNALLLKIDRTTTKTRDVITDPKFGLAKVQDYAETAWKVTRADKIVNALNTMLIIHNGLMLSNNMLDTVSAIAETGLQVLGIKDEEDKPIDIGAAIGGKITGLLQNTLGKARYEELTKNLASKIRIYQSGANILYNVRSIFDSAQDIAETTGENVAFIGNALRRDGVVRENSYRLMPTDLQPSSRLLYRLERANDALDTIEEVTEDVRDIKEELSEMQDNAETFTKEVKEATDKQQRAIDEAKTVVTSVPEPSETDEERGVENGS